MKVARLTTPSAHHLLGSSRSLLADTAIVLSRFSCTSYLYLVLIRCTGTLYILTCTMYSCQAMSTKTRSARYRAAQSQTADPDGERARLSKRALTDAALKLA